MRDKLVRWLDKVNDWGCGFYIGKNPWQDSEEKAARNACREIVERLGDEPLSTLGRQIRDIALKGLK